MSLESAAYYPVINNSTLMQPVDIEYSYRTCAQVYQPYCTLAGQLRLAQLQTVPPEPFANKVDAVLYVNSNCWTKNGRHLIMRELSNLMAARKSKIQLHSYGRCDRSVGEEEVQRFARLGGQAKIEFGRQYKFCVAMENSNEFDYVTEKVYNALQAGCLPIYYGAPNIADYVPDMRGLIMVQGPGTAARLLDELERLAANQTAYEEKLMWKSKGFKELSPGFQRLHALPAIPNDRCRLCKLLAEHRDAPKNYTLCHANSTWQEARRRVGQQGERRLH